MFKIVLIERKLTGSNECPVQALHITKSRTAHGLRISKHGADPKCLCTAKLEEQVALNHLSSGICNVDLATWPSANYLRLAGPPRHLGCHQSCGLRLARLHRRCSRQPLGWHQSHS